MTMTQEHKDALAKGRTEGKIVRRYLENLGNLTKADVANLSRKLIRINTTLEEPGLSVTTRLGLYQERINIRSVLHDTDKAVVHASELEDEFVKVAKSYSDRKGLSRKAWRAVGVPARVLDIAGIK